MVVVAALLFVAAIFFCLSAVVGWLVMLAAGNLYIAGVLPVSLSFTDSFWLGVIFTTLALVFSSPNAVK